MLIVLEICTQNVTNSSLNTPQIKLASLKSASSPHRPDADAFGEAVVRLDVVKQLPDGHLSQPAAVVGFIRVQHHCRDEHRVPLLRQTA